LIREGKPIPTNDIWIKVLYDRGYDRHEDFDFLAREGIEGKGEEWF